jgi:acetolactate decarboxylase
VNRKYIYFNSVTKALFENVLNSNKTIEYVKGHGDFGIGTIEALDGELIVLDGKAYTVRGDGVACKISDKSKTPITIITHFKKDIEIKSENINFLEFQNIINGTLPSQNLLYSIKVQGTFINVKLRGIDKQIKPYLPISEIIKKGITHDYTELKGVLVGFKIPNYLENISVPGFHFHFIDNTYRKGGHLYYSDFKIIHIEIGVFHNFIVELDDSTDFYNANINKIDNHNMNEILKTEFYK